MSERNLTRPVNGKNLFDCLQSIPEPMTYELIVEAFGGDGVSEREREKIQVLLKSSVHLGFCKEINGHYVVSTHVKNICELLEAEPSDRMTDEELQLLSDVDSD